MAGGEDAIIFKQLSYYEDMTKFGKLGLWILMSMGADKVTLEDLIGEAPTISKAKQELTEEEKELIELAKKTGLNYKITANGVKIY